MSDKPKDNSDPPQEVSDGKRQLTEAQLAALIRSGFEQGFLKREYENKSLKATLTLGLDLNLQIDVENVQRNQKQNDVKVTIFVGERIVSLKTDKDGKINYQLPKDLLEGITEEDPLYITLVSPEDKIDFEIENLKRLPINLVALPDKEK